MTRRKKRKVNPFYVKPPTTAERAYIDFNLQRGFLKAWGIEKPRKIKGPLIYKDGDNLTEAVNEIRVGLHELNQRKGLFTQDWMRSALFLRCVAFKNGEGFEVVRNAIWAYTAALIDGVEKVCSNPAALEMVSKKERFNVYAAMVKDLKKALAEQVRLLDEIKSAKIEYERNADVLDFGRLLIRSVHCPDPSDTNFEYRAFVDAIAKFGPGAIPDTDWDAAVMISKAILTFEAKKQAEKANAAQKTALKGDLNEAECKCEGEG